MLDNEAGGPLGAQIGGPNWGPKWWATDSVSGGAHTGPRKNMKDPKLYRLFMENRELTGKITMTTVMEIKMRLTKTIPDMLLIMKFILSSPIRESVDELHRPTPQSP